MNYTEKYHLPQWVNSDRVKMEDFNEAMASIESGLTAASALPFAVGSYVGTSGNQTVHLSFTPSFLIITGMRSSKDPADNSPIDQYFAIVGSNGGAANIQLESRLQIISRAFIVFQKGANQTHLPILNEEGRLYYYIAFR